MGKEIVNELKYTNVTHYIESPEFNYTEVFKRVEPEFDALVKACVEAQVPIIINFPLVRKDVSGGIEYDTRAVIAYDQRLPWNVRAAALLLLPEEVRAAHLRKDPTILLPLVADLPVWVEDCFKAAAGSQ